MKIFKATLAYGDHRRIVPDSVFRSSYGVEKAMRSSTNNVVVRNEKMYSESKISPWLVFKSSADQLAFDIDEHGSDQQTVVFVLSNQDDCEKNVLYSQIVFRMLATAVFFPCPWGPTPCPSCILILPIALFNTTGQAFGRWGLLCFLTLNNNNNDDAVVRRCFSLRCVPGKFILLFQFLWI